MTQDQPLVIPSMEGGKMTFPEPQAEPTAPAEAPAVTPEPTPPVVEPTPEAPPEPEEDLSEGAIWERVVASDPDLRQRYMQQQYGQAPQPSAPQQQLPEPPKAPALDLENFDVTNPEHLMGLFQQVAQQQNAPLIEYVEQLKQQEEQQANQIAQQQTMELERGIHKMVDGFVPGFSEFAGKDPSLLNDSQLIVRDAAISLFAREMSKYPREAYGSTRLQQEVMKKVGPKVKAFAASAGLNRTGDPVATAEMHMQPSAATAPLGQPDLSSLFNKAQEGDQRAQVKYTNTLFEQMNNLSIRSK